MMEPEGDDMKIYLPLGEALGKYVHSHVICRTVHKLQCIACYNMLDEVVLDVDVIVCTW